MDSTKNHGAAAGARKTEAPASPARGGRQGGFTLLETVIALFFAMVMGFGAISLFLYSVNYNAGAADRARALALAQQKMEELRAVEYEDLAATNSTVTVTDYTATAGTTDYRTFSVTTVIANDSAVANSRQKVIAVTVTPTNNSGWAGLGVTLRSFRASTEMGPN